MILNRSTCTHYIVDIFREEPEKTMYDRTKKLYDDMPYDKNFEAEVVDVIIESKKTALILDKTLFFPEEGGQSPDKGHIRLGEYEFAVADVQIRDDVIYHYVSGGKTSGVNEGLDKLEKGLQIIGEIDFEYRYSNMQQHSGEHIFSGLAKKHFDCTNVGFHLSDNEVTFDYDKPLSEEDIVFLETEVNKVIFENHRITAYYPDKDELLNLDYRSKKEIEGDVRLVEIEDIDLCACCAPHVRSTGEIGICKVVDFINYKGGVRISILCGSRALEFFRELDNITRGISRTLSAKRGKLVEEVNRINDALNTSEYKLIEANRRYLDMVLNQVSKVVDDGMKDADALHRSDNTFANHIITERAIILKLDDFDNKSLRDTVNKLKDKYKDRLVGTVSKNDKGYFFILGSVNIDCNKVAVALREKYNAKGGGSADMIQGNLTSDIKADDIDLVLGGI